MTPTYYDGIRVYPDDQGCIDTLDFIEGADLSFSLGNVVKYVVRAGKKPGASALDDLTKAAEYIARAIRRLNDEAASAQIDEIFSEEAPGEEAPGEEPLPDPEPRSATEIDLMANTLSERIRMRKASTSPYAPIEEHPTPGWLAALIPGDEPGSWPSPTQLRQEGLVAVAGDLDGGDVTVISPEGASFTLSSLGAHALLEDPRGFVILL